jgi:hypothetical protein
MEINRPELGRQAFRPVFPWSNACKTIRVPLSANEQRVGIGGVGRDGEEGTVQKYSQKPAAAQSVKAPGPQQFEAALRRE